MNTGNKKTQVVLSVAAVCAALVVIVLVLAVSAPKSTDDATASALTATGVISADDSITPVTDIATPKSADDSITPEADITSLKSIDFDILGCYVSKKYLYVTPLSSNGFVGASPLAYGFSKDSVIIANTEEGYARRYGVEYCKTPVGADELTSTADILSDSLPDISGFKERYLLAIISDEYNLVSRLYKMDGELWLVEYNGTWIWTIQRLEKAVVMTIASLEWVLEFYENNQQNVLSEWIYEGPKYTAPRLYENQMAMKDVFALARKGEALTIDDFEPYYYVLTGADFSGRRYDVVGADTVFVAIGEDGELQYARLLSRRTVDESDTVDLRDGFEAVTEYMNPLRPFGDILIERPINGEGEFNMFFDDDYFQSQCRYYLNIPRVDKAYVLSSNGDRMMTIQQALADRRVTVEDLVAHGLYGVRMIPVENPLGGEFTVLGHTYRFWLNDEEFYPSKSFVYAVYAKGSAVYYDIAELLYTLVLYGYEEEAKNVWLNINPADVTLIAGGNYVRDTVIAKAGLESRTGWEFSSHTPVWFSITG